MGAIRLLILALVLVFGLLVILICALLPFIRIRGARLAAHVTVALSRFALWLFSVKLVCPDREKIRQHRGLLLPNHVSYADILALVAVSPTRFLSNHQVKYVPFVGIMAIAIETVFVNRGDKDSRAKARVEMAKALTENPYPPLALFPEGGINNGDLKELLPFHLGAFRVAQESKLPILPCVIEYSHPEVTRWMSDTESMYQAVWRMASWGKPQMVRLTPLEAFSVSESAGEIHEVAEKTRQDMQHSLNGVLGGVIDREHDAVSV